MPWAALSDSTGSAHRTPREGSKRNAVMERGVCLASDKITYVFMLESDRAVPGEGAELEKKDYPTLQHGRCVVDNIHPTQPCPAA